LESVGQPQRAKIKRRFDQESKRGENKSKCGKLATLRIRINTTHNVVEDFERAHWQSRNNHQQFDFLPRVILNRPRRLNCVSYVRQ